jgi:hypothetical protein
MCEFYKVHRIDNITGTGPITDQCDNYTVAYILTSSVVADYEHTLARQHIAKFQQCTVL